MSEAERLRQSLREDLRELRESPAIGLPDYGADPAISRRIGVMLASARPDRRWPDDDRGRT
jgi:hypothetical protein